MQTTIIFLFFLSVAYSLPTVKENNIKEQSDIKNDIHLAKRSAPMCPHSE